MKDHFGASVQIVLAAYLIGAKHNAALDIIGKRAEEILRCAA